MPLNRSLTVLLWRSITSSLSTPRPLSRPSVSVNVMPLPSVLVITRRTPLPSVISEAAVPASNTALPAPALVMPLLILVTKSLRLSVPR